MSVKTLPLLFINLGGEMLYILDQRLRAQNIAKDKAVKVLHDIVHTMLSERFVEELFKPQELYSKKALRTVFDRLAHASIMRLNSASMDKLYDLMVMAFKYQTSLCLRPQDILLVTLNHMDAIREFVKESPAISEQVSHTYKKLAEHYANLTPGEFLVIRQTLFNFFQDMHIRVSVFLRDNVQEKNGHFILPKGGNVPYGADLPGTIKLIEARANLKFNVDQRYLESKRQGSYDLNGDRVTRLGTNMYTGSGTKALDNQIHSSGGQAKAAASPEMDLTPNPAAKAQLDLLATLIGGGGAAAAKKGRKQQDIRLNLFSTDEEEAEAEAVVTAAVRDPGSQVVNIDATQNKQNLELAKIMGELTFADNSSAGDDGDDLLELMDSAQ